jgi:hypothetical protein
VLERAETSARNESGEDRQNDDGDDDGHRNSGEGAGGRMLPRASWLVQGPPHRSAHLDQPRG